MHINFGIWQNVKGLVSKNSSPISLFWLQQGYHYILSLGFTELGVTMFNCSFSAIDGKPTSNPDVLPSFSMLQLFMICSESLLRKSRWRRGFALTKTVRSSPFPIAKYRSCHQLHQDLVWFSSRSGPKTLSLSWRVVSCQCHVLFFQATLPDHLTNIFALCTKQSAHRSQLLCVGGADQHNLVAC